MRHLPRGATSPFAVALLLLLAAAPPPTGRVATPRAAAAVARQTQDDQASIAAAILIVWPHDATGAGAPVASAPLANVSAVLASAMSGRMVPCDFEATVRLWTAVNNAPARAVAVGRKRLVDTVVASREPPARAPPARYAVWDFDDIDVAAAQAPANRVTFFVDVQGPARVPGRTWPSARTYPSIWVHATDGRTMLPVPAPPSGTGIPGAAGVDTVIRTVWPHDEMGRPTSVEQGPLVNVTAALFLHDTRQSVPPEWHGLVTLSVAFNNSVEFQTSYRGQKRVVSEGGVLFPVWDFVDVPVPGAADPGNRYYFWVRVDGVPTAPAIWAHGADARTYLPGPFGVSEGC